MVGRYFDRYYYQKTRTNKHLDRERNFFVRIKLKDLFGFADQEKTTYGLGYTLTLKRNSSNDVVFRTNGVDAAKVLVKDISWYIPHYVPSLETQQLVMDQILNKDPTELKYIERTVFRKDVNTNNNWIFELGNSGLESPIFVILGFQARKKKIHKHTKKQHLLGYQFQMLFVKKDQKNIPMME